MRVLIGPQRWARSFLQTSTEDSTPSMPGVMLTLKGRHFSRSRRSVRNQIGCSRNLAHGLTIFFSIPLPLQHVQQALILFQAWSDTCRNQRAYQLTHLSTEA